MTKTLRNLHFAALCSAALIPTTQAETIWADGVSLEGGWVDINKSVNGNQWANSTEGTMCYAIAAANLITWWQSKYEIPEGTPNTAEDIWATYLSHGIAGGGNSHYALQWWFSGQYFAPAFPGGSKEKLLNDRDALYFNEAAVSSSLNQLICFSGANSLVTAATSKDGLQATIINALRNGIGLAIGLSGNFSHTVTLWGVEVDDKTQQITKIWLTDSDDARQDIGNYQEPSIFSVDVQSFTKTINNQSVETLKLVGNDGGRGYNNVFISALYGIDPSVSNSEIWGLSPAVPEPTTATLSLMALAALAARRRRH